MTCYGLRQGAPSSPTILNLIMKDIIRRLKYYGHGIQIGSFKVPGAAFADDSWLVADCWDKAQAAYYTMVEGLAYFGLEANPQKSYCWSIPRWKGIEEFGDFGDLYPLTPRIPYASQYKYLGLTYKMQVRREVTLDTAINKAKRLEGTIARACLKAGSLPIAKLV